MEEYRRKNLHEARVYEILELLENKDCGCGRYARRVSLRLESGKDDLSAAVAD